MKYIIVGLGNPEPEYADTRHNAGRIVVESFRKAHDFPVWEKRKEIGARASEGFFGDTDATLLQPDEYMNNSGKSVAKYLRGEEESYSIIVHDDIDLPIGTIRISYDRGAGGHNGVLSLEKELKTRKFVRVRIGISPVTFFGTIRKPKGEQAVQSYVLKKFTRTDVKKLEDVTKKSVLAIDTIIKDGVEKAMNAFN